LRAWLRFRTDCEADNLLRHNFGGQHVAACGEGHHAIHDTQRYSPCSTRPTSLFAGQGTGYSDSLRSKHIDSVGFECRGNRTHVVMKPKRVVRVCGAAILVRRCLRDKHKLCRPSFRVACGLISQFIYMILARVHHMSMGTVWNCHMKINLIIRLSSSHRL
jgi:hypothetical protein